MLGQLTSLLRCGGINRLPVADAGDGGARGGLFRFRIAMRAAVVLGMAVAVAFQWRTLDAHRSFGFIRSDDAVAAMWSAAEARRRAPWDWQIRQQLYLTVMRAVDNSRLLVTPEAEQRAWAISVSASPYNRTLHAARVHVRERMEEDQP